METQNTRRGFTLIELLVVVLIIGILAAVAVPQYQKAVKKAQLVKAITFLKNSEIALQGYILQHGFPEDSATTIDFLGEGASENLA